MTELYVSPHLDDVALSCAARIVASVAAGRRVVVATLFSAGPEPENRTYRARRGEDRAALTGVGAEVVHLGLADAPFRLGRRLRFEDLLLGEPPTGADVARTAAALEPAVHDLDPDRVWLPLGVGGHVDHRATFACRSVTDDRARFYLERPYAFVPALVTLRTLEIEGGALADPPSIAQIDDEIAALGSFFAPGERARCVAQIRERLCSRHPGLGLRVHRCDRVWPDRLDQAVALADRYASQLPWLTGGDPSVLGLYRRHGCDPQGRHVEPCARLVEVADRGPAR